MINKDSTFGQIKTMLSLILCMNMVMLQDLSILITS